MRKGLRIFLLIIGAFVGIALLAWIAGTIVATRATTRSLAAEWPLGLGPASTVPQRFPKIDTNAEARRIIELSRTTGIELEPRSGRSVDSKTPAAAEKSHDEIREELSKYQSAQTTRADDAIDAPPEKVATFVGAHATEIAALRQEILRGERIEWATDLMARFDAPIPNLLGHMKLARLFVTDALMRARNNDATAWEDLHAIWMLDEPLRRRPDLISQLISIASTRMTNGAARKLPPPEPAWYAEVKGHDGRRSLVAAEQAEGWMAEQALERAALSAEEETRPFWWPSMMALLRPYSAIGGADLLNHHRLAAEEVAGLTKCAFDGEEFDRKVMASMPKWDYLGRVAMPGIGKMYHRQIHLVPEIEATSNLLRLKAARAASPTHQWPASLESTASRCSDGTWIYERRPDGSATLRFSKELKPLKFAPQPLAFSLAR